MARNLNLVTKTVHIDKYDWRALKSKLALQGKTISEWLREKIKQELSN